MSEKKNVTTEIKFAVIEATSASAFAAAKIIVNAFNRELL